MWNTTSGTKIFKFRWFLGPSEHNELYHTPLQSKTWDLCDRNFFGGGSLIKVLQAKINGVHYFLNPWSIFSSGSTSIAVYATTLLIYRLLKMKCQVSVPYIPSIGHISHLSHILNTIYSIQYIFHSTYIPFTIYSIYQIFHASYIPHNRYSICNRFDMKYFHLSYVQYIPFIYHSFDNFIFHININISYPIVSNHILYQSANASAK